MTYKFKINYMPIQKNPNWYRILRLVKTTLTISGPDMWIIIHKNNLNCHVKMFDIWHTCNSDHLGLKKMSSFRPPNLG